MTAFRSAGSHKFADVIAIEHNINGSIHLIQSKVNPSESEIRKTIDELRQIIVPLNTTKELWIRHPRKGFDVTIID